MEYGEKIKKHGKLKLKNMENETQTLYNLECVEKH